MQQNFMFNLFAKACSTHGRGDLSGKAGKKNTHVDRG
jgi:hypothetical protein